MNDVQLFYATARLKKATIMAVLRGGAVIGTLSVSTSLAKSFVDGNVGLQQQIVAVASSQQMPRNLPPPLNAMVSAIISAGGRVQVDGTLSFCDTVVGELGTLCGQSDTPQAGLAFLQRVLIKRFAILPFLIDMAMIGILHAADLYSQPYIPRFFSPQCNTAVCELASRMPAAAAAAAAESSSNGMTLSALLEFQRHYTSWWIGPRLTTLVYLLSDPGHGSPCIKLGQGDGQMKLLGYNINNISRTRAVTDQAALRAAWELTATFVQSLHEASYTASSGTEASRKVLKNIFGSVLQSTICVLVALLLSTMTKLSPYTAGLLGSMIGGACKGVLLK